MSQPRSSHWRTTMRGFPGMSRQRAYLRSLRNARICPARTEPKARRAQPSRAGVATSHLIGRGEARSRRAFRYHGSHAASAQRPTNTSSAGSSVGSGADDSCVVCATRIVAIVVVIAVGAVARIVAVAVIAMSGIVVVVAAIECRWFGERCSGLNCSASLRPVPQTPIAVPLRPERRQWQ